MKSYITVEGCKLSASQQKTIKELLKITGGKPSTFTKKAVVFTGPGDCHVITDVYDDTINLTINWLEHPTALEIIHLLVNRRDK